VRVPVVLIGACQSSGVGSSIGVCIPLLPALAETMCRPPKASIVSATAAPTAVSSLTSVATAIALPPAAPIAVD